MNRQSLSEYVGRAKYEATEAMNRGGEGLTAFFRLLLILGMLLLLAIALFLNLLDEQLAPEQRTEEVAHQ